MSVYPSVQSSILPSFRTQFVLIICTQILSNLVLFSHLLCCLISHLSISTTFAFICLFVCIVFCFLSTCICLSPLCVFCFGHLKQLIVRWWYVRLSVFPFVKLLTLLFGYFSMARMNDLRYIYITSKNPAIDFFSFLLITLSFLASLVSWCCLQRNPK